MKALYTNTDILTFTSAPIIVKVVFPVEMTLRGPMCRELNNLVKHTRKITKGTWGVSQTQMIDNITVSQYFFFNDESDLLVFLLKTNKEAKRVTMWPTNLRFTIYEY